MHTLRRITVVFAVAAASVATTAGAATALPTTEVAQHAAEDGRKLTRIDTDAAGNPESAGGEIRFAGLSGNGRYALFAVRTNSNMVPEPHRAPTPTGEYLVRKDTRTGATLLVSVTPDGRPLRLSPYWHHVAIGLDGTTFAYTAPLGDSSSSDIALYHHDLASGVRQIATVPPRWSIESISMSADGRWLTWVSRSEWNGRWAGDRIHRHDLVSGGTKVLLQCEDLFHGCYWHPGVSASDDGTKLVFRYQAKPQDPALVTLLDTTTGELRTPSGAQSGSSYQLSGDGKWLFFTQSGDSDRFELKKVATTPGATPVSLGRWDKKATMHVSVNSVSRTGNLVGLMVMNSNGDDPYFRSPRTHILDQSTGGTSFLPDPRPGRTLPSFPTISRDGQVVVVQERCLRSLNCGLHTGWYSSPLHDARP
ncbi:TolB family protein [Streptoalloteichus hindustanus]|uniref:WD40-like Beta Propeller Repeat n=1 Tax=Streptoalloteichus hindustanus TaxID=2017 RepID=A0A1M5I1U2_STRHI|nr:hypothetical protein [Streptoalloteichus hindustanus]SHG21979.1 hypothetical protein SAMN05444320_10753 [Streptoalloteichus hindustanus]